MVSAWSSSSKSEASGACLLQDFLSLTPRRLKTAKTLLRIQKCQPTSRASFAFAKFLVCTDLRSRSVNSLSHCCFCKTCRAGTCISVEQSWNSVPSQLWEMLCFFLLSWRTPRLTCWHVQISPRQMKSCHPKCDKDVAETWIETTKI